ncbi:MAG: DUF1611 domain-containing protein [Bacteroidetes bacterium]|jgi:uncharacterized NAD-dependent epimerase/dehydratase family protein|nr:DUF1611 domain-containing protein [Bacteroidota bacterium]
MNRVALLAHDQFPHFAKTATGLLRYSMFDVAAVLDRGHAGKRVHDLLPDVQDAPIVASMADAPPVDALIIGIANVGGGFAEDWRSDVRTALQRGCTVMAGLHDFLTDDDEFAALAEAHGATLHDVRKPPQGLQVSQGRAREVSANVVLTVGTDCAVGKMTVALELTRAAQARGERAAFIPTGQTGIMIAGWGYPIDAIVSDFVAGAVEQMILKKGNDYDWLFVEGQGSIIHPAYSAVTCGILHGAMPDALVLCHEVGRTHSKGFEGFPLPNPATYVDLYEGLTRPVHPARVAAGALNTRSIEDAADARAAVKRYGEALGLPATDPVRFGPDAVLAALS